MFSSHLCHNALSFIQRSFFVVRQSLNSIETERKYRKETFSMSMDHFRLSFRLDSLMRI